MTLAHLMGLVGPPPVRAETHRRSNGEMLEWGWRDTMCGSPGWWYAVTRGERVVVSPRWTIGGEGERDEEIRRAIAQHMRSAAPEAIA